MPASAAARDVPGPAVAPTPRPAGRARRPRRRRAAARSRRTSSGSGRAAAPGRPGSATRRPGPRTRPRPGAPRPAPRRPGRRPVLLRARSATPALGDRAGLAQGGDRGRGRGRAPASTASVCSPGYAGGRSSVDGVRSNRGAGADCGTPSTVRYVPRAARCGCAAASSQSSTGATHASLPANTAVHSSRVRVANSSAQRRLAAGQPAGSSRRSGASSGTPSIPDSRSSSA